jgi:hypothetical protein
VGRVADRQDARDGGLEVERDGERVQLHPALARKAM